MAVDACFRMTHTQKIHPLVSGLPQRPTRRTPPRRGPCRLSFAMHGHPTHVRATPLPEGACPVTLLASVKLTPPKTRHFPTIGKIFSNHWKNHGTFFQSLENRRKIFPIVGKLPSRRAGAPPAALSLFPFGFSPPQRHQTCRQQAQRARLGDRGGGLHPIHLQVVEIHFRPIETL